MNTKDAIRSRRAVKHYDCKPCQVLDKQLVGSLAFTLYLSVLNWLVL